MAENGFQPQLALSSYNNQSLFSDHYLDEILRRDRRWQQVIQPAAQFLAWLRDLYAREKDQLPHYNEDQLEDKWFKPIFERLGHADWEGQAVIPGWQGKIKKPDFVFFPDEVSRKTAVSQQNTTDYAKSALTVVEVKQWEVNLSKKTGNQPTFADQNPMYQIDTYLTLTGLEWGVLSNGRFWRLLHKNSSRTLETYFEIDLLAALTHPDDGFATAVAAYFWLFFSDTAFRPEPQGHTFLQEALDQSRAYALALEADLRDNAYRALEQLIIGFFAGDGRLDAHNPADRTLVYQNSLYLLYRLLFIFYGESRALLPVLHPLYREQYALQQLTKKIDRRRNELDRLPTTGQIYWQQLQQLFRLISGGDAQLNADLGVPRYNGGLFDPEQHPFLEVHFVGDRALARAVDYLATRRIMVAGGKPAYQSVDYRTLDVRQLGSIYEGLLEYRVAIADEELVTITKKKVETWVPAAKKGKAKSYGETRQPGDLYLTTDKGERKATGSYYTPDYIVEYIVENTLGPVVAQVRERVKAAIKRANLRDAATRQQRSADLFIAEILALNVLDPAMGSGHFLVEATHYLARVLATDEYTQVTGPSEGPVTSNGETDLLYWKRRVVEACIYGVDKNPMAVELAKLSLWLKTAAADKPLSFLDHHLQHGDSLIGAWLDDLERAPGARGRGQGAEGQESLFDEGALTRDVGLAVKGVATIERLPTLDIETVHAKEAAWRDIQQTHMDRWRRLADLWVSAYFGNEISAEEYRALAARLQGQDSLLSDTQAERFLTHPAVTDNDYFHWQLAFPEVFFDENGNSRKDAAGFDAVIGNPPYVAHSEMRRSAPNNQKVLEILFDKMIQGHWDLYVSFIGQSLKLCRYSGYHSFIVPSSLGFEKYATKLRRHILLKTELSSLTGFGEYLVFENVARQYVIYVARANSSPGFTEIYKYSPDNAQFEKNKIIPQNELLNFSNYTFRVDIGQEELNLRDKLDSSCIKLGCFCFATFGVHAYSKSGGDIKFNTADVIHVGQPKQGYKKYIEGETLSRYQAIWNSLYMDYESKQAYFHRPKFPELFENRKLMIRRISGENNRLLCHLDQEGFYTNDNIIHAVMWDDVIRNLQSPGEYEIEPLVEKYSLAYIAAIVNSSVGSWYFSKFIATGTLQGSYSGIYPEDIRQLPVHPINFALSKLKLIEVIASAKSLYTKNDFPAVLNWVVAELSAKRNDTIHDLLAYLVEQMIAMNKEKQAALEAFWLDLEGVSDASTFATLRSKGKQQASLHKAVPAARAFVSANSRSSVNLDATLEWNEDTYKGFIKLLVKKVSHLSDLVQVYRDHAPAVAALSQRLAATDRLIDQVVYQLYGLTPEEITIVEGA